MDRIEHIPVTCKSLENSFKQEVHIFLQGCHTSGKFNFFQGQGIVREFCKLSGKFGLVGKCQGIDREF